MSVPHPRFRRRAGDLPRHRGAALVIATVLLLAVTLLVGVGDGARIYLDEQISGLGTNLMTVVPGRRETRGFGPPAGNTARPC